MLITNLPLRLQPLGVPFKKGLETSEINFAATAVFTVNRKVVRQQSGASIQNRFDLPSLVFWRPVDLADNSL
jgi:hypothetical protein